MSRRSPSEASTALERGAFDIAIIYADSGDTTLAKHLRSLRSFNKTIPTIVIAPEYNLESEQLAFDEGADLYFSEPVPKQTLERMIQHTLRASESATTPTEPPPQPPVYSAEIPAQASALHILRDFSKILSFSLDYKAFTQHFILKLRDHISFSRIGIFLENDGQKSFASKSRPTTFACIASFGLPADLVDCYQLSRDTGLGRALAEQSCILHRQAHTSLGEIDSTTRKEFDILGCQLAIPICNRERLIGVAVLNGPITGRNYSEDELQLLYLLMEELGLSIRNSRLHSELAAHGQLIENVLGSISSGALVLSEQLEVIYTNNSAKHFLGMGADEAEPIEWGDLPNELAAPIHRAVELGELPRPFLIHGANNAELHKISLIPFAPSDKLPLLPRPVMVVIEDYTHIEASKQSALKDSKSQLINLIAKRFAHEIRNSLVPLTTHMQLIDKKIDQPKFQTSLKSALTRETSRIKRLSEQMLYLAEHSKPSNQDVVDLETAILDGFSRAKAQGCNNAAKLSLDNTLKNASIHGNVEDIAYAFEELFLNSIQSSGSAESTVHVILRRNDEDILTASIRDNGPGFADETLTDATEPFFSTRTTGVGLGLSVAKKIIEEHQGFIQINSRTPKANWDIKIELPATLTTPTQTQ
ncbi:MULTISPECIES: sensor histidine kinase [unclassified Lentimonas]|uniref:sensor histidine kinase n=1 Tax=unclassified Lentimonas TaxID=2630993 RepID=UPI001389B715|nr:MULTISPECIES: sensor histidine kinase [unclassified Lentimonas]